MMVRVYIKKKTIKKLLVKSSKFLGKSGVYFLKHKTIVVYIGQTTNLTMRIHSHLFGLSKVFDDFDFETCHKSKLIELESYYIDELNPIFNKENSKRHVELLDYCIEHGIEYVNNFTKHSGNLFTSNEIGKRFKIPYNVVEGWGNGLNADNWKNDLYRELETTLKRELSKTKKQRKKDD